MSAKKQSLMLQQHVVKRADDGLHCREISLKLSSDNRDLILSRYTEHYSPDGLQWVERSHRVPVTDLLRWMIAHGEPQPLLHSGEESEGPPTNDRVEER